MNKLEKILYHVGNNNSFYKKILFDNKIDDYLNINNYPILTREMLQLNRYNMFSDGYQLEYYNQKLKHQSSSGTLGMPITVYWNYNDWYISNLSLWRRRQCWYNIKPDAKFVSFSLGTLGIEKTNNQDIHTIIRKNELMINVSFAMTYDDYLKIIKLIYEFSPEWFYVQPSILNKLIECYTTFKDLIPRKLKYIETYGELLTIDTKNKASKVFDTPIVNMYGSEEMNCIAYTNKDEQLCVLDENVYLEVYRDGKIYNEGIGEAIITNLNNFAMPLIRYLQGDIIELKIKENNIKEITKIYGRNSEGFNVGEKNINPFLLSEIIFYVNNDLDDIIRQFQYVYYKKKNKLVCKVVVDFERELWIDAIRDKMLSLFKEKYDIKFGDFDVINLKNILTNELKFKTIVIEE